MKRLTFNPNNFDPGARWVNPGHVIAALALLAFLALFIYALAT